MTGHRDQSSLREPAAHPRILQVCAVDFTALHFLLPLMEAQRAAGFDVRLACAPGPFTAELVERGFHVYPIPFQRSFNLVAHLRAYRKLAALLRARPVEIVHTHTPVASLIARPAARRAGTPLVLYTAHGFYFHEAMRPAARAAHIWLERTAQRRWADYLFTQSREDLETALREGIAPPGCAMAIGNGVDVDRFAPGRYDARQLGYKREQLGLAAGTGPVIMTTGRLVREKGYFELIEALAAVRERHPAVRALIVGEALASDHDDSAAAIARRVAELGLGETMLFAGRRDDVPELLALADLFCLPSWREGLPRSIIEAMASGLPVVATDIRGCREEVVDGRTGLLVAPRDPRALAEALLRLIEDESLRRRMGEAGRARALEYFDERQVIERQQAVLRGLMAQREMAWPEPSAKKRNL